MHAIGALSCASSVGGVTEARAARLLLLPAAQPAADHETFESTDAGASLTYPQQAGTIRKNGFMVIKGRPCKVRTPTAASQANQQQQQRSSRRQMPPTAALLLQGWLVILEARQQQ